ncbi:esterase [Rhodococcus sp. WMMA185]|uniref:alpha/beta hydrolase n=1 Tax=Rhodococcus sp. WMMA185 TaxID=679318 RepID=UPI000878A879|nr:alpha/beta hydrolase family protein [Rhodococcus sp. WMMA185]AOW93266.1 esterase [Rhodococcus sp. WMMA185]
MVNRTVAGRYGVRLAIAAAVVATLPGFGVPALASAAPADNAAVANGGTYLVSEKNVKGRTSTMTVHSASMDRDIPLQVIRPADTSEPRPTLYLLNGAGGGEDNASWQRNTDLVGFFADKNVNVVSPLKGAFSYYTDWEKPDPELGVNKWTTFLTEELPPVIDEALGTNGVNAIAGISMAGSSVLSLAEAAPHLYTGVGAYSGCAMTSSDPGRTYVNMVVGIGGGDPENMWGPEGGPGWVANDPYVNAEKLRGLDIYVSNGTGLPGPGDRLDGPGINGNIGTLANQIIVGGAIEAATNQCTHALARKLHDLGIPATFDFRPTGTHSWSYWEEDLHKSWPMLAASMGI